MSILKSFHRLLVITLLATATVFSSCNDDDDPATNPVTDGCGMPNGYLKWTIEGAQYCANATLFGDQAIIMTINGITQSGQTMTLELDSTMPGTYEMKGNVNHLLYTDQFAFDWQSTDSQPGTITITNNDTVNHRIEGSFQVNAKNSITGSSKQITNGSFRILYTQ